MRQESIVAGYHQRLSGDPAGLRTLQLFSGARAFNGWMFERIRPFCRGNLLEIGSGIGNLSRYFLQEFRDVSLSDLAPEYLEILAGMSGESASLKGIYMLDLANVDLGGERSDLAGQFDTVVALNVIEHIHDHAAAVRNCWKLLRPGGRLVMLVPAYSWLFNGMDEELGHFRRYRKMDVAGLLEGQGFRLMHAEYFNAAAILGWWVNGSLLGMRRLGKRELTLYNYFLPLIRLIDRLVGRRVGVSVIAVGEKPDTGYRYSLRLGNNVL